MKCRPVDIADALTVEQQLKLIAVATHAEPLAVAPYVAVLALDTGMRSGEIKQLQLGDLHHEVAAPYLIVRRATTKTDAGARRVSLGQLAVWAISKLLFRARELGAQRLTDCLLPTDRTRHTRSTDPLRGSGYDPNHPQTSWDAEWERLRQQVGIENRRFHDLRHTFITRSAEAGVPIPITRTQVGHLSEAMTRYYTHIGQQAQYEATRKIERHRPELLKLIGLPKPDAIGKDRLEFERVVEGTASRRTKLTIN